MLKRVFFIKQNNYNNNTNFLHWNGIKNYQIDDKDVVIPDEVTIYSGAGMKAEADPIEVT